MIRLVGLGRMGLGMARRWHRQGLKVVGFDEDPGARERAEAEGVWVRASLEALAEGTEAPRLFWLMVPQEAVEGVLQALMPLLRPGDRVADGGNSFYKDSLRRSQTLAQRGIGFVDVGVSGGVRGEVEGYGLMVGGDQVHVEAFWPYLLALAPAGGGLVHAGGPGAGHYAKMVHNAIEYGLMEAYAEGVELLAAGRELGLDPAKVVSGWRQGTIVRGFLLDLLAEVLAEGVEDIAPVVAETGEARWALREALERRVSLPAIAQAFFARVESQDRARLRHRILAALRHAFGGHEVVRGDDR
ncbi:decarboxylating 6-phosphogluconate dehydrogenase [Thermus sp. FJN-A]